MTQTTDHQQMARDLYTLKGEVSGMSKVLDRMEAVLEQIDARLANLEAKENSRSALERAAVWLSGVIGAAAALIVEHFWK